MTWNDHGTQESCILDKKDLTRRQINDKINIQVRPLTLLGKLMNNFIQLILQVMHNPEYQNIYSMLNIHKLDTCPYSMYMYTVYSQLGHPFFFFFVYC